MRGTSSYAPRVRPLRLVLVPLLLTFTLLGCGPDRTWRPAFEAVGTGWVMNIWGPAPDDLFAVGGAIDQGRILHYDGADATEMTIPSGVPLVNWTFGFGPSDIHAVGNEGTLLHYDGNAWSQVTSPTDQDLWGVWGAASDDVWAVGGTARRADIAEATLLHYDGSAWSLAVVPPLTPANVAALFKVWGSGPNDVYAVGDVGTVIHYDGTTWSELLVGASDDLVAVWGTGPDNVVAVGGRGNGIVSHWNGSAWRTEFVTPLPGLNGVWIRDPDHAHIVGIRGTVATLDLRTFEFEVEPVDEGRDFHAIFGPGEYVVAVGGNLSNPASPEGIAHRRDLASNE